MFRRAADDLSVHGDGDPVSTLLVGLLLVASVEDLVGVATSMWSTGRLALLGRSGGLAVGGDLLQPHGTTEVEGDLLVKWC
jgi:hypothetical protein